MMKTKVYLTLCLLGVASLAIGQLPRIVLQPDGGGTPQVFLNFDDAINAAQDNDRLYLSGGNFESTEELIIDFPIHLIGAGIHPDSTIATNPTVLNTSTTIRLSTGGSNSTFTGIRFSSATSSNFQYGPSNENDDPTGIYFERCEFDEQFLLAGVQFFEGNASETIFNECIFREAIAGADNTTVTLRRCILDANSDVNFIDGGGLLIDHCIFFGNANIANSEGSTVRNSIFTSQQTSPLNQSDGSSVLNSMTSFGQWFGNSSGTVSNSFIGAQNPFVNEINNAYDYTDNLQVSGGVAEGGALDGTDMGIYGSSAPAKLGFVPHNPHFIEVEVAPSTDGDGNLPVTILNQSQTY